MTRIRCRARPSAPSAASDHPADLAGPPASHNLRMRGLEHNKALHEGIDVAALPTIRRSESLREVPHTPK